MFRQQSWSPCSILYGQQYILSIMTYNSFSYLIATILQDEIPLEHVRHGRRLYTYKTNDCQLVLDEARYHTFLHHSSVGSHVKLCILEL